MLLYQSLVFGIHLVLGVERHALQDIIFILVGYLEFILILRRYSIKIVRF